MTLLNDADKIYLGNNLADRVYVGATKIWPPDWTPAVLGADLLIWYDAADAATIELIAGGVVLWRDKSTYGRNATELTGEYRPSYANSIVSFGKANEMSVNNAPTTDYDFAFAGRIKVTGTWRTWLITANGTHIPFLVEAGNNWIGVYDHVGF